MVFCSLYSEFETNKAVKFIPNYKLPTQITNINHKMFDFENLDVYKKAKELNKEIFHNNLER